MDQMDILNKLGDNFNSSSSLQILMQIDNVLEKLNVYTYENWIEGEIVDGPLTERYWVTVTLMYPYKLMPNPDAAQRIIDFGGRVDYAQDELITAAKLVTPDDVNQSSAGPDELRPGQSRAKSVKRKIWLVTLQLPRDVLDTMQSAKSEIDNMAVDNDAVDQAYDDGLGEDEAFRDG